MFKYVALLICFFSITQGLLSQKPNFTANSNVPTYNTPFRLGVNPGYNPGWTDEELSDIAAEAGIRSFRVPLPETFLEQWGYDVRVNTFQYYDDLNIRDNTVFLEDPTASHKSTEQFCAGQPSVLFKNMYEPIWNSNGTVNEDNYAAMYAFKTASLYKDYVKFWEIWNEPDYNSSSNGWKPKGDPGNWWENVPDPCEYKLKAPIYHYIRLLRINYEVIKSVDPDAFITVGGIGFESFLDLILRFSDNPDEGKITAEYPLGGGAYFDALSFHTYPHNNGTLRFWDNGCNCFKYKRHSDAAAEGLIDHKDRFQAVLHDYGYDGSTFPKKITIVTETNIPNKAFGEDIGSPEAQLNYALKAMVYAYQNGIQQIAFYKLADTKKYSDANFWQQVSGFYQNISNQEPHNPVANKEGIGTQTFTNLIFGSTFDAAQTQALNLPSNIAGGAFLQDGQYTYVLWAKTTVDNSEEATASYSFPSSFGLTNVLKKQWDFSQTGATTSTSANNIVLSGVPTFFVAPQTVSAPSISQKESPVLYPSPAQDYLVVSNFTGTAAIFNLTGQLALQFDCKNKSTLDIHALKSGIYVLLLTDNQGGEEHFKIIKQ